MLLNHTFFDQLAILSLQTGTPISHVSEVIIDPGQLQIIGFRLEPAMLDIANPILLAADIREMSPKGIIIDHVDRVASEEDLVRQQNILQLRYSPLGSAVQQKNGKKLGKVAAYSIDNALLSIQRLSVESSLFRSLTRAAHIIHRSQIISVATNNIIVDDPSANQLSKEILETNSFVNPFRQPQHHHNQED